MLRIAITDDHALFRSTLTFLINDFKDMQVALDACNGEDLLEKLKTTPVDILLLDLQMPVMDGFETCQKVKELYPQIKVIILTQINDSNTIKAVIKMNAQGYFTKNTPSDELEEAIWKLEDNGFYFEKGLASVIKEIQESLELDFDTESEVIQFTERELEIIRLIADRVRARDIAKKLNISPKTVNAHKQNIQQKYNFPDMIAAVLYCVQQEIIKLNEINLKNR